MTLLTPLRPPSRPGLIGAFTHAAVITALACAATTARADSLASSASSAGSAASGSVSDSLHGSSNSSANSSNNGAQVADGDYRILAIAPVPDREGRLRLTLQPEAAMPPEAAGFALDLPAELVRQQGLGTGDTLRAQRRVYGIEFARTHDTQPFFLVLADTWYDELAARRVQAL